MGKPARFPVGPFILAAQFKVPVCYAFAMRRSEPLHYHFRQRLYYGTTSATKKLAAQKMVYDFAGCMEQMVKQHPEQWYNYYDFWA